MAQPKKQHSLKTFFMIIVATVLLIVFLVVALLVAPEAVIPEFNLQERDWGPWEAHGRIAVFDEKIKPGDDGYYEFIIINESVEELRFGITFTEYLNTVASAHAFMQYRLSMNGVNVAEDDEWRYANAMDFQNMIILPETRQLFKLEWRWLFENGMDSNDTLIGRAGGELAINCLILAEVMYED